MSKTGMPETLQNLSEVNLNRRGDAVGVGEVHYGPKGSCGPRIQLDYQLVVMFQGEAAIGWNQHQLHLQSGWAILLTPGAREHFSFTEDGPTHHGWCSIAPHAFPAAWADEVEKPPQARPWSRPMADLYALAADSTRTELDTPRGATLLRQYAHTLIGEFLLSRKNLGDVAVLPTTRAVARVRRMIRQNYHQKLTLTDLAREACMSRQHLLRVFKQHGLKTPTEELWSHRLEVAADLLIRTGLTIDNISDRCGFANPFHFSRKFRQVHGRSPRAFRQATWTSSDIPSSI